MSNPVNAGLSCPNSIRYPVIYRVRDGDTIADIAAICNLDSEPKRNYASMLPTGYAAVITNPNLIHQGDPVCIPSRCSDLTMIGCAEQTTVYAGEYSLYSVSERVFVDLDTLKWANPEILNFEKLFPGQALCLRRY